MLPNEDIESIWSDLVKYKMNSKCRTARRKLKKKAGGVKKQESEEKEAEGEKER